MSNNYTLTSIRIPLPTLAEQEWVTKTLKNLPKELEFQWDVSDGHLSIWSDENCNIEQIAAFLELYIAQDCCVHDALGFQFAETCSRPLPDHFGGGAVRIRNIGGEIERENFGTNMFLEDWSVA